MTTTRRALLQALGALVAAPLGKLLGRQRPAVECGEPSLDELMDFAEGCFKAPSQRPPRVIMYDTPSPNPLEILARQMSEQEKLGDD